MPVDAQACLDSPLIALRGADDCDHLDLKLLPANSQNAAKIGRIKYARAADYYDLTLQTRVRAKITSLNSKSIC